MTKIDSYVDISNTIYMYDSRINTLVSSLNQRVSQLRQIGRLSPEVLQHIRKYFRIKNIHHSNAIEGNRLDYGETRLVVEEGLTITGKPLKDTLETKNLAHAMDFFEKLASTVDKPITATDVRQIHYAILKDINNDNAGKYRQMEVEISGSQYKPPSYIRIPELMDEYSDWLTKITSPEKDVTLVDPIISAAVAHTWFVYIHPFIDGNGRTARILMNLVLMRFGYPVSIITKDDRHRYYDALEESQSCDLTPFISLLCDTISESLDEYEKAAAEQRETDEWARSLIVKLEERETNKIRSQFEVWRSAMELMKGYFKQVVGNLNEQGRIATIYFREYDIIDFEKYLSLRQNQSAKRTWFFRINFSVGDTHIKYLFFFDLVTFEMQNRFPADVTVHIAREERPSYYERLDRIATKAPRLREIAYSPDEETFICRFGDNDFKKQKVETFARQFITDVINIHF